MTGLIYVAILLSYAQLLGQNTVGSVIITVFAYWLLLQGLLENIVY